MIEPIKLTPDLKKFLKDNGVDTRFFNDVIVQLSYHVDFSESAWNQLLVAYNIIRSHKISRDKAYRMIRETTSLDYAITTLEDINKYAYELKRATTIAFNTDTNWGIEKYKVKYFMAQQCYDNRLKFDIISHYRKVSDTYEINLKFKHWFFKEVNKKHHRFDSTQVEEAKEFFIKEIYNKK